MEEIKFGLDTIKEEMLKHFDKLREEHNILLEKYNKAVIDKNDMTEEKYKAVLEKDQAIIERNNAISERDKKLVEVEKAITENKSLEKKVAILEEELEELKSETNIQISNNNLLEEKLTKVTADRDSYFQSSQKLENEKIELIHHNEELTEQLEQLQSIDEKCSKLENEKSKLINDNQRLSGEITERLKIDAEKTALSLKLNDIIDEFKKKVDELEGKAIIKSNVSSSNTVVDNNTNIADTTTTPVVNNNTANTSATTTAATEVSNTNNNQDSLEELERKLEEAMADRASCDNEIEEAKKALEIETGLEEKEMLEESIIDLEGLKMSWEMEIQKLEADIEKIKNQPTEPVAAPQPEIINTVVETISENTEIVDTINANPSESVEEDSTETIVNRYIDTSKEEEDDGVDIEQEISTLEKKLLKSIKHRDLLSKRLTEAQQELRHEYGFEKIQELRVEIKELEDKKAIEDDRIIELEVEIEKLTESIENKEEKNNDNQADETSDIDENNISDDSIASEDTDDRSEDNA